MALCHVAVVEAISLDVPFDADLGCLEHGSLLGLFSSGEGISVMLVVVELERSILIFVSNHHLVFLLLFDVGTWCNVCDSVVIYRMSFLGGSVRFEARK